MAIKGDVSDLDTLEYGGKPIVPRANSYNRTRQSGVRRTDTSGGASRQRKKYYGGTHLIDVNFYLEDAQQQDFFEMFTVRNEGKRFICHLAADRPIVEPYVVQFASEVNFDDVDAKDAIASVTLEVFPARDPVLDDYLYENYKTYGSNYAPYINGFREIVELMPYDN